MGLGFRVSGFGVSAFRVSGFSGLGVVHKALPLENATYLILHGVLARFYRLLIE